VLLPSLLLEQVVVSEEEGWQGLVSGDHRCGMTKLRVQTMQGVDDHGRIRHWMPDVAQEIGEVLEAVEVVIQFALEETVEFLDSIDNALIYVVEEEATNGAPDDVRHWVGNLDHLHEIRSNRSVEP
jgi:hypothetical protein